VLQGLTAEDGAAFVPVLWRFEVSAALVRAQATGTDEGDGVS
jgi:hypothetical protein